MSSGVRTCGRASVRVLGVRACMHTCLGLSVYRCLAAGIRQRPRLRHALLDSRILLSPSPPAPGSRLDPVLFHRPLWVVCFDGFVLNAGGMSGGTPFSRKESLSIVLVIPPATFLLGSTAHALCTPEHRPPAATTGARATTSMCPVTGPRNRVKARDGAEKELYGCSTVVRTDLADQPADQDTAD